MKNKIKSILKAINDNYFWGKYKSTYKFINKKTSVKEYIFKFVLIFGLITGFLYIVFNNLKYSIPIGFALTIFYINEIVLNSKVLNYENYILSQLTIYTSQVSLLVTYNNIYSSLKEVTRFVEEPLKTDLQVVISNIDKGLSITDSFKAFNEKYNNRTITLYNQTLELFDSHGNSDANTVLEIISEEMNTLKIKKDKFFRFKKEWRLNYYVVVFLCLLMPIILRFMIPDIYMEFMASFGSIVMIVLISIIQTVTKKVESIYRDQSIGEGGYQ